MVTSEAPMVVELESGQYAGILAGLGFLCAFVGALLFVQIGGHGG